MKVLALVPSIDTPDRYNYLVNYSLWDSISKITDDVFMRVVMVPDKQGGLDFLLQMNDGFGIIFLPGFIEEVDVVFLPMNIRLKGYEDQIEGIKGICKNKDIKIIMFDNDDLRRKQNDPLYDGIDIIFSRMYNDNGRTWLPWCVDTEIFTPVYGGEFISMPASRTEPYKLRREIASKFKGQINLDQPKGAAYIKHLQRSKAVICTGSEECRVTKAKVLEAAACGCLIITEETYYLNNYFPINQLYLFKDLKRITDHIEMIDNSYIELAQKKMNWFAEKHSAKLQARKVVSYIESFLNGKPDKDILYSIQNPLE